MLQDVHVKLNPGLPWQKQHSTRWLFKSNIDLNLWKSELVKYCIWGMGLYGVKHLTLWKIRNTLKSFEMCCWRRVEQTSWTKHVKNDIFQRIKEERTSCIQQNDGRLTGMVTFCTGTAFWNTLFKERYKGREDEEEDVSSY